FRKLLRILAERCAPLSWSLMLLLPACQMSLAQASSQSKTLVVNGQTGETTVLQLNGRTYVDLESLARIANGSIAFQGNRVTLALPVSGATPPPTGDHPAARTGLSREFREAAIETLARMREWASTMANALQHGYPITDSWAVDYREKAAT